MMILVLAIVLAVLMAATIELCESNEIGEVITHNITTCNYGSDDSPNIVIATYPVTAADAPAGHSYDKLWRIHLKALGVSNGIDNIQIWKVSGAYVTGEDIQTNLTTGGYSAESYATPSQTEYNDNAMPTADPGAANLGIGGSLAGQITATGYSDYMRSQTGSSSSTPPGDANSKVFRYQYDEW